MKRTILITGSGGLLGSELLNQLLVIDTFEVIAMTSKVDELKEKYNSSNIIVISNDNWNNYVQNEGKQIDLLVNCAFPRSSHPEELALGIPFTEKLIKDSIKLNIKSIINISSQSVYTQKDKETVTEDSNVTPESLYGITKYACERIVAILCEQNGIKYTNIRLASLTGINFDVRMTNRFVNSAIKGEKIIIHGGNQKISYLDVRDAARALIIMMNSDSNTWKPLYNLGNDESFTLIDLVEFIKEEANKYRINSIDVGVKEGNSNYNNLINSELFYREFDFRPKYDMKKMIKELFNRKLSED